jgi:hypothetical protein
MRWRLIIEDFSPELIYLKGQTNLVADALSRLELATEEPINDDMHNIYYLADNFGLDDEDLPEDAYPLEYALIAKHQNFTKGPFC